MTDAVVTVAEMVEAEQGLVRAGISVDQLMQRAGRGAARWVWRLSAGRPVSVLCGPGNNGGDGYVIAEEIRRAGGQVRVIAPVEPKTDAARNARTSYSGEVQGGDADPHGAVLVDCLFGSGLARPLDEAMTSLLHGFAGGHQALVAVDLPSGVESDTGACLNEGLPAYDLTLSLGAWKFAHWLMPSSAMMGARRLVPIGVDESVGEARVLARPVIRAPAADDHKYRRGLLAIVAGAMPGAALLAAQAAMHGGAGYVKLIAPSAPATAPADLVIETGEIARCIEDPRIAALLVGPGLGRGEEAHHVTRCALASGRPVVLDADALVVLSPDMLAGRRAGTIATPHEGELARLAQAFGLVGRGKLDVARALAATSGMVVIAKGPDTIIAAPDGSTVLAPPASSWLSVAGTGDVLAGIAASRLATGRSPLDAACEAVWLHGEAARIAGTGFTAGELAGTVRSALANAA